MKPAREQNATYRLVLCALIAAVGMLLGYLESLFPLPVPIPGIKLGFANIAILFALYALDVRAAAFVAAAKLLLVTLLFGNVMMAAFSLGGTLLSFAVMALLKATGKVPLVAVSSLAGAAHNAGQLVVAGLVLQTAGVVTLAPVLLAAGLATGVVTGLLAQGLLQALGQMRK